MNDFRSDNELWQLPVRDRLISPYYARRFCKYVHLSAGDVFQWQHHVDTIAWTRNGEFFFIDEKIMRRRNDGGLPVNVSCETWSCTVPGYEKLGWIAIHDAVPTHLLYCFADSQVAESVTRLDCLWIPFPALVRWFWHVGEARFTLHAETTKNKTHSRNVPILDIINNVSGVQQFQIGGSLSAADAVRQGRQFEFITGAVS